MIMFCSIKTCLIKAQGLIIRSQKELLKIIKYNKEAICRLKWMNNKKSNIYLINEEIKFYIILYNTLCITFMYNTIY